MAGGNNASYKFGAELLEWLAPESHCPVVRIPVTPADTRLVNEDGIMGRPQVVAQLKAAQAAWQQHNPDKVVVPGGDCLVDLAPSAYPAADTKDFEGIAGGQLDISDVPALINQVDVLTKIVGLGIAEHLPWDAINMKKMLNSLPLLNEK